jgi:hypothetical protein
MLDRRGFALLPNFGIMLFLILYFYAASVYPGGTAFNHATIGYSHLFNFWCDLMDPVTYAGVVNPSRPIALIATVLMPLSFIPVWIFLPNLFKTSDWRNHFVRGAGCVTMMLTACVPLAHDFIINCAALLGFCALFVTQITLIQSREFKLVMVSAVAIGFALANYLMWRTAFMINLMPMVQKMAFLTFFIWVSVISIRARRILG